MHLVAQTKDLEPRQGLAVEVEGRKIARLNIEGSFHAIDDACTHVGGSVEGTVVTCPLHGARFDVTNGEVLGPPASAAAGSDKVHIDGDAISIEIP